MTVIEQIMLSTKEASRLFFLPKIYLLVSRCSLCRYRSLSKTPLESASQPASWLACHRFFVGSQESLHKPSQPSRSRFPARMLPGWCCRNERPFKRRKAAWSKEMKKKTDLLVPQLLLLFLRLILLPLFSSAPNPLAEKLWLKKGRRKK